jgi:isopenicillin-N N-acyltransferase-like protein
VVKQVPFAFYLYAAMREQNAKETMNILRKTSRGVGHVLVGTGPAIWQELRAFTTIFVLEPKAGVLVHGNHCETERFKKTDRAYTYIRIHSTGQIGSGNSFPKHTVRSPRRAVMRA